MNIYDTIIYNLIFQWVFMLKNVFENVQVAEMCKFVIDFKSKERKSFLI